MLFAVHFHLVMMKLTRPMNSTVKKGRYLLGLPLFTIIGYYSKGTLSQCNCYFAPSK